MKIAVCDDDTVFMADLTSQIYNYSNLHNLETVVDEYSSGYDLINSNEKYNIIILDYQMDNLDGLKTAQELRKGINKFTCIIFLTNYPEISIPAYEVDTYRFVVKNTLYEGLFKALDDFRNAQTPDYDICVKSQDEYITINTANIAYVEVQNKYSYICLMDGRVISTKSTLSSIYKQVPATHFYKIHKSYIVNFNYIQKISSQYLLIKCSEIKLPISRNYYTKFKERYINFLKDH